MSESVAAVLSALDSALRSLKLYPLEHSVTVSAMDKTFKLVSDFLDDHGDLTVSLLEERVVYAGGPVLELSNRAATLLEALSQQDAHWLRMNRALTRDELVRWLLFLKARGRDQSPRWEGEAIHFGSKTVEEEATEHADPHTAMLQTLVHAMRSGDHFDFSELLHLLESHASDIVQGHAPLVALELSLEQEEYLLERGLLVAVMAMALGRNMGLDTGVLASLGLAAMTCDTGLLGVDEELLRAHHGGMEECDAWVGHPIRGATLLARMGAPALSIVVAAEHHWGLGLASPSRHPAAVLAGFSDDLVGRLMGGFGRPERRLDLALIDLAKEARHYPPVLLRSALIMSGLLKQGAKIRLSNRKKGVIIETNNAHPLKPRIAVEEEGTEKTIIDLADQDARVTLAAVLSE